MGSRLCIDVHGVVLVYMLGFRRVIWNRLEETYFMHKTGVPLSTVRIELCVWEATFPRAHFAGNFRRTRNHVTLRQVKRGIHSRGPSWVSLGA